MLKSVGRFSCLLSGLVFAVHGGLALGETPVLIWNGALGAAWNATSAVWLDNDAPAVWIPGAAAVFPASASGTMIEVSGDIAAASVIFDAGASGVTLAGLGRLRLAAVASADAAATNAVATEILAPDGLAVSGPGAVALGRVGGIVTVHSGTLLAAASDLAAAVVRVEGGTLATLGAPDPAANLLANASFEENPLAPNSFKYANVAEGVIPSWGSPDGGMIARCYPTAANSTWISGGSVPDGNHVLIVQRQGVATQAFTVATAGFHQLSFYHFRRRGFSAHALTLAIDGIRLPPLLNIRDQFDAGRYASVPFWLPAGTHTVSLKGTGSWYDSSSMIDLAVVAPPSAAQPCPALGTDSSVTLASGVSALLGHAGDLPLAFLDAASGTVTGSGTWSASSRAYATDGTVWSPSLPADDVSAVLAFTGDASVPSSFARHLFTATSAALSGAGLTVSNLNVTAASVPRVTALAPTTLDIPLAVPVVASGNPAIGDPNLYPPSLWLDAQAPLALGSLSNHPYAFIVKTGPAAAVLQTPLNSALADTFGGRCGPVIYDGELSVPSFVTNSSLLNAAFVYALPGRTAALTLREPAPYRGRIHLSGDGLPTLNILASVTNAETTVVNADLCTVHVAAGATFQTRYLLRYRTSTSATAGNLLKTGSGILEVVASAPVSTDWQGYLGQTVIRAGAVRVLADDADATDAGILGRPATHAPVLLGDAFTAPDDTPALILGGTATTFSHPVIAGDTPASTAVLILDGIPAAAFPHPVTLARALTLSGPADAAVTFGTLTAPAAPQPLILDGIAALVLATAPGVDLDLGARALTLSPGATAPAAFHALAADGAHLTFEFGDGHDTVTADALDLQNLSVTLVYAGTAIPFAEPGTYALFTSSSLTAAALTVVNPVDGFDYAFAVTGDTLTLTIAPAAGNAAYIWTNPGSGDFAVAANWQANAAPGGADDALLGAALTANASVTLAAPAAADTLRIVNPVHRYTLAGGTGAPLTLGALSVEAGAHTVSAALQPAAASLSLAVVPGASLTFSNATLAGGLAGAAPLTLAGASALTLTGSGFTAAHTGPLSGTGILTLNAPGATQTLANRTASSAATLAVAAGTLALDAATFINTNAATVAAGATLAVAAPATNGLTAFWYNDSGLSVTNATRSRADLEAWAAARTPAKTGLLAGNGADFTHPDLLPIAAQPSYWVLVLRGSIDIPVSDTYLFYPDTDDYLFLAIDGREIIRQANSGTFDAGFLPAGRHDLLMGLSQGAGGARLNLSYSRLFIRKTLLPTAWLTPLATLSTAGGAGGIALAPAAHLRLTYGGPGYPQTGSTAGSIIPFNDAARPALAGDASAVFGKLGTLDILTLSSAAPGGFAGLFANGAGRSVLAAPDILAPSARLALYPDASLTLAAGQTAASLSGPGGLALSSAVNTVTIHDDADCGISAGKTYTHALDFGSNSGQAVGAINGVPFLSTTAASGTCTGTDGATYGFSDMPPTGHAGNAGTAASGNLHKLLYDMNYDGRNRTFALTGLNPAKTYELRIYQRAWGVNDNRVQLLGFIVNDAGRIDHQFSFSADAVNRAYYLAYRYRPSPSGTLRVRLTPYQYNNTLHLYGLTNEEVAPGGTGAPPATVLTLTGAPSATDYPGAITGDGLVAVAGPGTQAFSGVNTTPDGLAVTGGAAALHAGAVVTGPAAVSAPGALHVTGAAETGGLTGDGALALGRPAPGDPSPSAARIVFLSDDASTGISPDKRYTHLYDLGNLDPAVINGVAFAKVTGNTPTFTASPVLTSHNGNDFSGSALGPVPTASALYTLLKDMTYISAPNDATWGGFKDTVITLSGLTPGKPYELRIYNRSWGWGGGRQQLLAFCSTADGLYRDTFTFNPDALAPNALVYRYAPEGDTLSIKVSAMSVNNGWHLYGLSNEDLADPDAAAWAGGLTVAVPADRTDTFAGPIAGPAPLVKIGAGTLFLTGSSSANGAFTVAAGAFGAAFTDAAPLTAGPVVFAPGTAYVWNWSAAISGGTLAAGSVTLPEPFTVVAGGTGHPPARWPVIVSENAPLTPEPETVILQGFPKSVKAEYSGDRRILYLTNRRGTVLSIQ